MSVNSLSALQRTQYQDEFRMDFERAKTPLSMAVRKDGQRNGRTIVWDVVGPGGVAAEKDSTSNIPIGANDYSQVSATLREVYAPKRLTTPFDTFVGNPNVRTADYKRCANEIYRANDAAVIAALDTATLQYSASATDLDTLAKLNGWLVRLWNNNVPNDGRVWGILTPTAFMQMLNITQVTSRDFSQTQPLDPGLQAQGVLPFGGVKWFTHTGLTGVGTSAAKCYIWHEDAIGAQLEEPEMHAYYFEPENRFETYAVAKIAAARCLNRGIIQFLHDDTAAL